jgi:hypothetical protein
VALGHSWFSFVGQIKKLLVLRMGEIRENPRGDRKQMQLIKLILI